MSDPTVCFVRLNVNGFKPNNENNEMLDSFFVLFSDGKIIYGTSLGVVGLIVVAIVIGLFFWRWIVNRSGKVLSLGV